MGVDLARLKRLEALVAALTTSAGATFNGTRNTTSAAGTDNGVGSLLRLIPSSTTPNANALTVKRADSAWSTSPPYGYGQAIEVLSPSTQDASDQTGDGNSGGNPVLFRVDAYGGIGTVQGLHVAPGMRNTYGGGTPTGIWVQLTSVDTFGLVVSGPDPTYVPSPTTPLLTVEDVNAHKYFAIDANGDLNMYSSGTAMLTAQSGTVASGQSRLFVRPGTASARGITVQAETSQTANLAAFQNPSGTLLAVVDAGGDFQTFDDTGTAGLAALYAGTTPVVGFRSILAAGSSGTTVLALKQAATQTADLLATYDSSGTKISTIIDHTGNLVGGSFTVPNPLIMTAVTGHVYTLESQDTSANLRLAVDNSGDLLLYDAAGTNNISLWSAATGPSGYRAIFATDTAATGGVAIALATSQTAHALDITSGGSTIGGFDQAGHLLPASLTKALVTGTGLAAADVPNTTAGMTHVTHTNVQAALADLDAAITSGTAGVSSFNTRTGAVTLSKADVTGTGLAAADVSAVATSAVSAANGVAGLDASSRLKIAAGTTAPSNTITPVGWIPIVISGVVSKIPIYQ